MISKESSPTWYLISPKGGEQKVDDFLQKKDLIVTKSVPTLTFFKASLAQFYEVVLACPFASRMGQLLAFRGDLSKDELGKELSADERLSILDEMLGELDWPTLVPEFALEVTVKASSGLNIHEQFTAKRVAQAIVPAYFKDEEPAQNPVQVRVTMTEGAVWIGLDASPSALFPRLSPSRGTAAVKENLAALIAAFIQPEDVQLLIDPLCGSATLLLESLATLTGLNRPEPRSHCLESFVDFDQTAWENACDASHNEPLQRQIKAVGFDASVRAIKAAKDNLAALMQWSPQAKKLKVHLERRDLSHDWPMPAQGRAWLVMNPPYGKRLGEGANLTFFYQNLGEKLQAYANRVIAAGGECPGYTIISSDVDLLDSMRLPYETQERLYNGADIIFLRTGLIPQKEFPNRAPLKPSLEALETLAENPLFIQDFAQRLQKNYKKMASFLKKPSPASLKGLPSSILSLMKSNQTDQDLLENQAEPLRLFRLYNADIPEYNCAIDVYEHCVYVQEYKAPSKVDSAKAKLRMDQVCHTLGAVLKLPAHRILMKSREQQRGRQQYVRRAKTQDVEVKQGPLSDWHRFKHVFTMKEWGARFILNLGDYIDTGLFLDHRRLRWLLQHISTQKHILNLFSYTGSLSVNAALGGAASTTSVDLSPRYTAWTEHNLMANGCGLETNQVFRADAVQWLGSHSNQYDIILIDPPTFSNSKKADDFIVQDHHDMLIRAAMKHLQGDGVLFFSCNMKKFELDQTLFDDFVVTEISRWTQSPDFLGKTGQNQNGGHRCWVITRSAVNPTATLKE